MGTLKLGGEVEELRLFTLSLADIDDDFMASVGRLVALCTWFGIGDLHHENVVFGIDDHGRKIICPIDIELIFDNFTLPSQTMLLPSRGVPDTTCGLGSLLELIKERDVSASAASSCHGYLETMALLDSTRSEISGALSKWDILETVAIRVVARATKDYRAFLLSPSEGTQEMEDVEIEQLERGDVPYFFRFLRSREILYFSRPGVASKAPLSPLTQAEVTATTSTHFDSSSSEQKSARLKAGALQLARLIAPLSRLRYCRYRDCTVSVDDGTVYVTAGSSMKVACAI